MDPKPLDLLDEFLKGTASWEMDQEERAALKWAIRVARAAIAWVDSESHLDGMVAKSNLVDAVDGKP